MSDFFREVSEDVRRDQVVGLVRRFQWFIVAAVVLILAATGAWRFTESRRHAAAEAAGGRYQAASIDARTDKATAASAGFDALASDGPEGYSALARLRSADLRASTDAPGAIAAYLSLAGDTSADASLRDLARYRAALLQVDGTDEAAAARQLEPLAVASFPYHASVRELLALLALKRQDYAAAGRWLDQIVVDPQAPSATRGRAEAFLGLVASAAKPAAESKTPPAPAPAP